ncbi:Bug family tripartite tricarboxylate transporter substrate binding protein [Bradyrhizobium commune]|uniref:Tripartite tricarboxylate transporter substrate binding protein n=1 Tax=Bradyrhizobium commune TaxID=83627 RepID=A0A7S9D3E0_9BRAD|nr:tripartite tricarboxylate transporter substrate binding protein [Bradyrhizobium commune]QPF90485.1 tripartite tricarboxylate transporter substrate binding protein [Bradyrhizobium commune]
MHLLHQRFLGIAARAALMTAVALPVAFAGPTARAQTVRIVVPFPPGGGADTLARLVAEQIGRANGLTTVVENHAGAGTAIATDAVSRAVPDGKTLLLVANSFVINPALKALNYDPLTSFEPVCLLTQSPNVIAVNSTSPYRSLPDLVSAARARPAELTMAFQGPGTSQHVGFEKLKRAANIEMIEVPFTGAAPAVTALLGGHVTSVFANYPSAMEQIRSGQLRALAIASRMRASSAPDIPTIAELGFADYEEENVWFGIVVPARTAQDRIAQLETWLRAVMQAPDMEARLAALELHPAVLCGADFATFLHRQRDEYQRIVRDSRMRAE